MPTITKAQAKEIATDHIAECDEHNGRVVDEVRDLRSLEANGDRTPACYSPMSDETIGEDDWIVYLRRAETKGFVLESSDIIIISKKTGDVGYCGSAHDEG